MSQHDADARPIANGRLWSFRRVRLQAQVVDNVDGVVLDHDCTSATAHAPMLVPAIGRITGRLGRALRAVTADRAAKRAVDRDLQGLEVTPVLIPRRAGLYVDNGLGKAGPVMHWRALGLAVIVVLVASGCSNDDDSAGTTTCITDGTVDIDGCAVIVVRFVDPVNLAGVEAGALGSSGVPVAVWRTDAVCVPNPSPGAPIGVPTASAFAYWHADNLVERQNEGPPPTDGGYSRALRDRFEEEWIAARRAGVTFAGAALYLPTAAAPPDAAAIEWYRTDVVGVLYLGGHEQAMAPFFPKPQADC